MVLKASRAQVRVAKSTVLSLRNRVRGARCALREDAGSTTPLIRTVLGSGEVRAPAVPGWREIGGCWFRRPAPDLYVVGSLDT